MILPPGGKEIGGKGERGQSKYVKYIGMSGSDSVAATDVNNSEYIVFDLMIPVKEAIKTLTSVSL